MHPWTVLRDELRAAVEAFVRGDAAPYKTCWSQHDDCTLLGAFGGVVRGGEAIAARLDWAASRYRDGRYTTFDVLAEFEKDGLAYLVHLEQIESLGPGQSVVRSDRRVTHVARQEEEGWRIVHQHSDPLTDVTPPR